MAIILVVVSALAGYYVGSVTKTTAPHPAVLSYTSTTSSNCVQLESASLFLIVKNSSTGTPIGSAPVQVEKATPVNVCMPTPETFTNLGLMRTNANGSIELCCTGSTFSFKIAYLGAVYQLHATAEGAESAECVTLSIPSETTDITYGPTFTDTCPDA